MIRTTRLALLAGCSLALVACGTVGIPRLGGAKPQPAAQAPAAETPAKPARKPKTPRPPKPAKPARPPKPAKAPKPAKGQAQPVAAAPLAVAPAPAADFPESAGPRPPADVWPQSYAPDLPPDPAMRFGTLPNGLRYVIMRNATPGGQASLRLRIDAGSLEETDTQQGMAHLLEHMAFNGSTHVPRGEMIKILQRRGLAFGADTNASTSWDETIYKLDLPKADGESLDDSLMLLREVASELTLDQTAIEQEKGVVLSEERLRDTPGYRVLKASVAFGLPGQLAADRFPIGKVDVIRGATHDNLMRFYKAYYRPERAVLVAIGDFDPDAMEGRIRVRFGGWTGANPPGPDPDLGSLARRGAEARVVVQPGAGEMVQISWMAPPDRSPDSIAKRRRQTIESLGLAVLNRRLERLVRSDNPPFVSAVSNREDDFHSARSTNLTATTEAGGWPKAVEALDIAQRQLMTYGFSQAELDQEIDAFRTTLKNAAQGQATRTTPTIADDVVATLETPEVETSPVEDLALYDAATKGLTPDQVLAALRPAFSGSGPLVMLATETPIDGGDAAVLQAFAKAEAQPIQPFSARAAIEWPYADFGPPGKVADRREVQDIDTVLVRFENGVRLTVKPTRFRDEQILVRVRVDDGLQSLPPDRATPAWAASTAFPEGGLDQLSAQDIDQVLRAKVVGRGFNIGEDEFLLSGATKPDDLETQMQLLAAYVAHPGWGAAAFERMRGFAPTLFSQMDSTPAGVLNRDLGQLLHSGDRRWGLPAPAEIAAQTPADLKAMIAPALASGSIEVIVVGATTVDKAIDAVAATFGALPARPTPSPPPQAVTVRFPAPTPTPVVRTHGGRADQAIGLVAWPTGDFLADTQRARTLRLLGDLMGERLLEKIRKDQGLTYSPSADAYPSDAFPGYGYIAARVEIPPERLDGFFRDVAAIVADLKATDISPDELARIKTPAVDDLEKRRQSNEYWLNALAGVQTDPRRLAAIRTSEAQLGRVTAEDLRRAAQTWLGDAKAWRLEVVPRAHP